MKTKVCTSESCEKAGEAQPLENFHKSKTVRSGKTGRCGDCINKRAVELRAKHGKPKKATKIVRLNVKGKIFCLKMRRSIRRSQCVPGCNDACIPCDNKQITNIKAGDDTFTAKQEALMRHQGAFRSSAAIAIEDGYIDGGG